MNDIFKSILIVSPHADDEVIGMGATISQFSQLGSLVRILILADGVTSRDELRESLVERKKSAEKAYKYLGISEFQFMDFPDNKLDTLPILDLIKTIEKSINKFQPTSIFTTSFKDLNIDHQIAAKAVITAARPKIDNCVRAVFHFEVQSSTGWNFHVNSFKPNFFVDISKHYMKKENALTYFKQELEAFPSPRSLENILNLNKYRGSVIGKNYAEAFETSYLLF